MHAKDRFTGLLLRAARETLEVHKWLLFINSCRRYMAEILPICRKTLYNQSINNLIRYWDFNFSIFRTLHRRSQYPGEEPWTWNSWFGKMRGCNLVTCTFFNKKNSWVFSSVWEFSSFVIRTSKYNCSKQIESWIFIKKTILNKYTPHFTLLQ